MNAASALRDIRAAGIRTEIDDQGYLVLEGPPDAVNRFCHECGAVADDIIAILREHEFAPCVSDTVRVAETIAVVRRAEINAERSRFARK